MNISASSSNGSIIVNFDSFSDGVRIENQYSDQSVHFLNDYLPGRPYRASPQIVAHSNAISSPNVIVNDFEYYELFNSVNVPMVIWFDSPVKNVSMWLGSVNSSDVYCSEKILANITVYDCVGSLLKENLVYVSDAFDTHLEIIDSAESIRRVLIDYGDSACPEAIDDLTYQFGNSQCIDTTPPEISITSHQDLSIEIISNQIIMGTVKENGILQSVTIDGNPAQFYLEFGLYHFTGQINLKDGANTITVLAENVAGLKDSQQITLYLNMPSTVSLEQFHLTQRGVMQNEACDIDEPLVAGASTYIRVSLDVRTVSGIETYISALEMNIYRNESGIDTLIDSIWGTSYSPFLSSLNTPNDMTGILFTLPGYIFDLPGQYRFEFQAYVNLNEVGPVLKPNCGDEYLTFTETRPIKLYILSLQAGLYSPELQVTNHIKQFFIQLFTLSRTFPVRDGIGRYYWGGNPGILFAESGASFLLCDGTTEMQDYSEYYDGTGWTWKLIDNDQSGILRRADDQTVTDPNLNICHGDNIILGGRIISGQTFEYNFNPTLGILRPGAHNAWAGAKHLTPIDEDHDGDIDNDDLEHYIGEFLDATTNTWLPVGDIALYQQGDVFRYFQDQDGDNCNDKTNNKTSEPQADVIILHDNLLKIIWNPTIDAFNSYNDWTPSTYNAEYGSLWIPEDLVVKDSKFGNIGPGQGQSPGSYSWIQVRNSSTLSHELGHNVGGLGDEYTDNSPDDLNNKENAWVVYVGGESYNPSNVYAVMSVDRDPDRVIFLEKNYKTLFDELKIDSSKFKAGALASEQSQKQLIISGWIDSKNQLGYIRTNLVSGMSLTPIDSESPYTLVLGTNTKEIREYPFKIIKNYGSNHEGSQDAPMSIFPFNVVTPFDMETEWVELRFKNQTLGRREKSVSTPSIKLLNPNGGETFNTYAEMKINWVSNDPDGDNLTYSIYYSPNGGERWINIATGVTGQEFNLKLKDTQGTDGYNGKIKIIASDGFNVAEDENDASFKINGKPPIAVLITPKQSQTFLQGEHIHVDAMVFDPEDKLEYLIWEIDGLQHIEYSLQGDISKELGPFEPGIHTITLTAFDNEFLSTKDSISINVLADSDYDGMSDQYEETHGLNPGFVEDATWDGDEDGLMNIDEVWYGTSPDNADTDGDGIIDGNEIKLGSDPLKSELPIINLCNRNSEEKKEFDLHEDVFIFGENFPAKTNVTIYVIPSKLGLDDPLPSHGLATIIQKIESDSTLPQILLWENPSVLGNYDIWVDIDQNNIYDKNIDLFYNSSFELWAFSITERKQIVNYDTFIIALLIILFIISLILVLRVLRKR